MDQTCFESEVYALYAIDSLDGEELEQIQEHIGRGCETCRNELMQARHLWCAVGAATAPATPRPQVRRRILAAARASVAPQRISWLAYGWQQAVAAVLILAAGLAVGWNLRRPVRETRVAEAPAPASTAPLEAENRTLRARIDELNRTLAAQAQQLQTSGARLQDAGELQKTLARAQSDAAASAQAAQQAQARITQLETEARQLQAQAASAEAQSREANARIQSADNERRQALDREARLRETSAARIRQLEGENEKFRRVIDEQQRRIQQNTQLVAFFASPNLRVYRYQGTRNGPAATAHVASLEGSRVVLYAYHLPPLPAGRTYQLWLIRGHGPAIVSGGVFQPDQNGNAVVQFSDPALTRDVRQFAVTDEPAGGSPGPTGKQFLRASAS